MRPREERTSPFRSSTHIAWALAAARSGTVPRSCLPTNFERRRQAASSPATLARSCPPEARFRARGGSETAASNPQAGHDRTRLAERLVRRAHVAGLAVEVREAQVAPCVPGLAPHDLAGRRHGLRVLTARPVPLRAAESVREREAEPGVERVEVVRAVCGALAGLLELLEQRLEVPARLRVLAHVDGGARVLGPERVRGAEVALR